jgi:hypothetical protein
MYGICESRHRRPHGSRERILKTTGVIKGAWILKCFRSKEHRRFKLAMKINQHCYFDNYVC